MSEHHKFRYLLPPGNNFSFVSKFRIWMIISIFLMAGAIGMLFVNKSVRGEYMNWTTDFKGGTEIIVSFKDASGNFIKEDPAKVNDPPFDIKHAFTDRLNGIASAGHKAASTAWKAYVDKRSAFGADDVLSALGQVL